MTAEGQSILWLDQVGNDDVARVGGKNASLGEMIANLGDQGVNTRFRDQRVGLLGFRGGQRPEKGHPGRPRGGQ